MTFLRGLFLRVGRGGALQPAGRRLPNILYLDCKGFYNARINHVLLTLDSVSACACVSVLTCRLPTLHLDNVEIFCARSFSFADPLVVSYSWLCVCASLQLNSSGTLVARRHAYAMPPARVYLNVVVSIFRYAFFAFVCAVWVFHFIPVLVHACATE